MQELKIENLVKRYPGRDQVVAVNHVNVDVQAGEMLVLLGPSGCGKTTLLRCVAGLEDAQEGRIVLEGQPVFDSATGLNQPTHLRDIGMVFQNYSLWPHMTVQRNVEYPLRARGSPDRAQRARRPPRQQRSRRQREREGNRADARKGPTHRREEHRPAVRAPPSLLLPSTTNNPIIVSSRDTTTPSRPRAVSPLFCPARKH